jgi:hypothetical protein
MPVYTVHEPPLKRHDIAPEPARFVFVRDGFSLLAFLLAPLWMLRHRMWLVLAGFLVVTAGLATGLQYLEAPSDVTVTVAGLIALLVGIEAGTLRRFTLGRRGFSHVGVVVADDREMAERRFFDSWVQTAASLPDDAMSPLPRMVPVTPDVIGLFPQPGDGVGAPR